MPFFLHAVIHNAYSNIILPNLISEGKICEGMLPDPFIWLGNSTYVP